jgi:DNA polymerase-3 subunit gamma/tau
MENYIVSARKYRPTTFESVVGQQALTQTLRNAIRSNRLAHAYLFCGPRGVGKTTCARIFAKTINCLNPTAEHEACNECESCAAFNEQRSFNIHELDAASNNSVEDIRSLIDQVRIPPQIGKYSVYIIDEVHMLSQGAFNALLKTLEEPPSYAIFILATTERHKILPTILSRCQVYDFSRITVADTIRHLQYVAKSEGITASEEALNVVAQKADGGMRDALSIFDQLVAFCGKTITYEQAIDVLNVLSSEYYFRLIDIALQGVVPEALLLLNEVLQKGFDAGHFITGLAQHLRDVLVSKDSATTQLLETSDAIRMHYQQQSTRCNARWIFNALDIVNTCDMNYRTARNKRLTVELALVKLCRLVEVPEVQSVSVQSPGVQKVQPVQPAPVPSAPVVASSQSTSTVSRPAASTPKTAPAAPPMAMPSLGNLGQIKASTTPAADTTTPASEVNQQPKELRNTPFTIDQLIDAWAGLSEYFPGEERLNAMLTTVIPELISPELCRITVANPWQKQEFAKFGRTVMNIVRDRLKNDQLKLQVEVGDYKKTTRAYTSAEKYKVLEQMNPNIADLRTRLNLQLE